MVSISLNKFQNVNVGNGVSLVFRKTWMSFDSDKLYGLDDSSGSPILVYLNRAAEVSDSFSLAD
jgi:hypothetical protein